MKEPKRCSIEGCASPVVARGWCHGHYGRWRRTGNPLPTRATECVEPGCGRPIVGQGWCGTHYSRYVKAPRMRAARAEAKRGRVCTQCGEPMPPERNARAIFCSRRCKDLAARDSGKNREYQLRRYYRVTYGLTWEQVEAMRSGGCQICGVANGGGRHGQLHIDHDHKTGKVRGALCDACNTGLGKFRDEPALLRAAADYLEGAQRD